ncbi:MAG: hypothetical protein N3G18_01515 [Candidatus Saccharicenans sp.]|nr:hypothetical protein [Candidatus Saccharicenans sp.]
MNEKDPSQMSDDELREFIKKFYAELDEEPNCAVCPVTSCSRRRHQPEPEPEEPTEEKETT